MSKKPTLEIDGADLTKLSPEERAAWLEEMARTHPDHVVRVQLSSAEQLPWENRVKRPDSHTQVAYRQNGVAYNIHGNPVEDEGCILI